VGVVCDAVGGWFVRSRVGGVCVCGNGSKSVYDYGIRSSGLSGVARISAVAVEGRGGQI
jgi:hypothetical protein